MWYLHQDYNFLIIIVCCLNSALTPFTIILYAHARIDEIFLPRASATDVPWMAGDERMAYFKVRGAIADTYTVVLTGNR